MTYYTIFTENKELLLGKEFMFSDDGLKWVGPYSLISIANNYEKPFVSSKLGRQWFRYVKCITNY